MKKFKGSITIDYEWESENEISPEQNEAIKTEVFTGIAMHIEEGGLVENGSIMMHLKNGVRAHVELTHNKRPIYFVGIDPYEDEDDRS